MLPDGFAGEGWNLSDFEDGITIDTRETCGGSRRPAVGHSNATDFESPWTGECPSCSGRFELLYGGFLPDHAPHAETPSDRDD